MTNNEPFKWVILMQITKDRGKVIVCPTEEIADNILDNFDGFIAIKYPRMFLQ